MKTFLLFVMMFFLGLSSNSLYAQDTDGDGISDIDEGRCIDATFDWLTEFGTFDGSGELDGANYDPGEPFIFTRATQAGSPITIESKTSVFGAGSPVVGGGEDGLRGDGTPAEENEQGMEYTIDWNNAALYKDDETQRVEFAYTFSEPVQLNEFIIRDIDRDDFVDGLKIQAFDASGIEVALNVTLGANLDRWEDVHNLGEYFYYYPGGSNADRDDENHFLTVNAGTNKITKILITASSINGDNDGDKPSEDSRFIFSAFDICYDLDTDDDGTPDYLDSDSDDDGCFDAIEGDGAYTIADVDTSGAITGTVIAQGIGDSRVAFTGVAGSISDQPVSAATCSGNDTFFEVVATGDDLVYQWQENTGSSWNDLSDGGIYSGATTPTLSLTDPPVGHDGNEYRVLITSTSYACTDLTSNTVALTVSQAPDGGTSAGPIEKCAASASVTETELRDNLTGESSGGVWTDALGNTVIFPITTSGTYTYTVTGVAPCLEVTATVDVDMVPPPPSAGEDGLLVLCSGGAPTNAQLYGALGGSPEVGGTWSGPVSSPGGDVYTYTQTATSPCTTNNTATVTLGDPTEDSDGDGVENCDEIASGTNPNNPCDYNLADRTRAVSGVYLTTDCDGDGVTNGDEIAASTDQYDSCDYVVADRTLPVSAAFSALDCDSDGNPNGTDPNPEDPTTGNDNASVLFYTSNTIDVLGNDDFLPQANNTITQVGGTAIGTVTFDDTTGEMIYTPDRSEAGTTVTVVYDVCYFSVCEEATVTMQVSSDDLDLSIEKTIEGNNTRPDADTEITFRIKVTNNEPNFSATNVEVVDVLPTGYEFVSASTSNGTYSDLNGVWTIGDIVADGKANLLVTVIIKEDGDHLNCATITNSNEIDVDSSNDVSCIEATPVIPLILPNGFTPNGDGINDLFVIGNLKEIYPDFKLEIINRWGNLVYSYTHNGDSTSEPIWWDGISSGQLNLSSEVAPAGTYFYVIYLNDNIRRPKTGWVYLKK